MPEFDYDAALSLPELSSVACPRCGAHVASADQAHYDSEPTFRRFDHWVIDGKGQLVVTHDCPRCHEFMLIRFEPYGSTAPEFDDAENDEERASTLEMLASRECLDCGSGPDEVNWSDPQPTLPVTTVFQCENCGKEWDVWWKPFRANAT